METAYRIMSDAELRSIARSIVREVNEPGPLPRYHSQVQEIHRHEWPALWYVLDELVEMDKRGEL